MKKIMMIVLLACLAGVFMSCYIIFPGRAKTYIVYVADMDGDAEIFVRILDDVAVTDVQITDNDVDDYEPHWSPDGSKISYFDENGSIFVTNADGSNRVDLSAAATESEMWPKWSPDGVKIAFGTPNSGDIWMMNTDGTDREQILDLEPGALHPDISPDGTKIAYVYLGDLYTADIDGMNISLLVDGAGWLGWPRWSPDGTKLVFLGVYDDTVSSSQQISIVTVADQTVVQLTSGEGDKSIPFWTQNGKRIAFSKKNGVVTFHDMKNDGTDERLLLDIANLGNGFHLIEK